MSQQQLSRPRFSSREASRRRRSVAPDLARGTGLTPTAGRAALRGATAPPRPLRRAEDADLGATTVEYAMVVLAAAAFGGVMAAVLSSGQVRELLTAIVEKALGV
ncbi:DUF4244 domain-containing protein [Kocuria turfanensis]|uniref:DUF4244 domain-containing protein n=1 Tax=Kocuria turfanensis TaxID=388357 RepID=A0A512IAX3_9MICC|nr:DUF4244 domain-containing protein [Kocuria turfanensis]GEO94850.1 hypothetical protein KTU01_09730 [Kocuria turfanensis]